MQIRPPIDWPQGRVVSLEHHSKVLQDNPWRDPAQRQLGVYLPAGYSEANTPYIQLWDLAAFTNSGLGHLNWRNHGENLPARLDRLIGTGRMPPAVVLIPDCFTALGGTQYINSSALGAYSDYLVEELIPFVSQRINVNPDGQRGVFGKSSGGYGALLQAISHPQQWQAVAVHAADIGFDWVYLPEFPTACRVLAEHGNDIGRFLKAFWRKRKLSSEDFSTLLILAMAASYDPDPDAEFGITLPFTLDTCEIDKQRWQTWLQHDPLQMQDSQLEKLRGLTGFWLDVGRRDQFNIQFGSRRLHKRLMALNIDHEYQEFDGTHLGIDHRLDESLPYLARALANTEPE